MIKPPEKYGYADLIALALNASSEVCDEEPASYKEAVSCENSGKWREAMEDEMKSLYKNNKLELVQRPRGQKVVGCKRIFKLKKGIPNVVKARHKARLVAKGFTMRRCRL